MLQASVVFLALMVARVGACVAVLPLLGGPQMPRTVKAFFVQAAGCASWQILYRHSDERCRKCGAEEHG